MPDLTIVHYLYGLITLAIILTMVFKKDVVMPALLGTFLIGWLYKGSLIDGFTTIFHANLVAAQELFSIFLIITFMIALLHSLRDLGADQKMIEPIQKVMVNGHISFFVLFAVTYIISLFFWPTPAVPLICALLVPAAIRSGLPAMTAAVVIAISGQGMALSSDYIIQVAPSLSATSAGIATDLVADQSFILSIIAGITALAIAYILNRNKIRSENDPLNERDLSNMRLQKESNNQAETNHLNTWRKIFALLVPLTLTGVVLYMVYSKLESGRMGGLEGGDGAAFVGGVAVILLLLSTVAFGKQRSLSYITSHITDGFVFAFKAMGPVIPIAGFFFLGSNEFSHRILGLEEAGPSILFDLVQATQSYLPESSLLLAFSILIIGIITGLDGSGFSGLPLTGALSGALATEEIAPETLAAIGQMGAVWTGGGTLVAWSSLIAIAGFCGVSAIELVQKNFIPVIIGLVLSTVVAVILF